jgi:hypothetical protein
LDGLDRNRADVRQHAEDRTLRANYDEIATLCKLNGIFRIEPADALETANRSIPG